MIWRHQSRLPSKDLSEFFRLVKLRKVNTMAKMAFYKAKKKIEPELKRLLQQYNEKIELQNRNYFRAHHSLPPNNDSHDLKSFNLLKKFLSLEWLSFNPERLRKPRVFPLAKIEHNSCNHIFHTKHCAIHFCGNSMVAVSLNISTCVVEH